MGKPGGSHRIMNVFADNAATLLGSSVIVSIISIVGSVLIYRLNRRASLEDRRDELKLALERLSARVDALTEASMAMKKETELVQASLRDLKQSQMVLFHSAIYHRIADAMHAGKITQAERSTILKMHDVYHNVLGGNGDLNEMMKDLNDIEVTY